MKIDLKKLATNAVRIAGPIVAVVVAQKLATGKLNIKDALLDAASKALANRMQG